MWIDEIKITSCLLFQGTMVFGAVDVILITLIYLWIKPPVFSQMKWEIIGVTFLVWSMIWVFVLSIFWDSVYTHVFPGWAKTWIPIIFGTLMGVFSYIFWRLSNKLKNFQLPFFFLLTGLWGVLTHSWAIQRGILTKPPMLIGSSPNSALTIAFFEYVFYWCVIVILAKLISQIFHKTKPGRD